MYFKKFLVSKSWTPTTLWCNIISREQRVLNHRENLKTQSHSSGMQFESPILTYSQAIIYNNTMNYTFVLLKTSYQSLLLTAYGQLWNQFDFMQFGLRLPLVCNKFVFNARDLGLGLIKHLLKETSMLVKIYRNGNNCAWYHDSVHTTSHWTGSDLNCRE